MYSVYIARSWFGNNHFLPFSFLNCFSFLVRNKWIEWNYAQCSTLKLPRIISLRCSIYLFDVFCYYYYFSFKFTYSFAVSLLYVPFGDFSFQLCRHFFFFFQCLPLHVAFVYSMCLMLNERYINIYLCNNGIISHSIQFTNDFATQNESFRVFNAFAGWLKRKKNRGTLNNFAHIQRRKKNEDKYAKRWNSH